MNFKKIFVTGILFLMPTLITIFLIFFAVGLLDKYFADPLGSLILQILIWSTPATVGEFIKNNAFWLKPAIGFPLAIIIVVSVGYLAASLLGRQILAWLEKYLLSKFPIVSLIYPHAKKLTDTFLNAEQKARFKAVVAFEYPRRGIYSIGFVTSDGLNEIKKAAAKNIATVFVPSSPTPFTGYTIQIPKEELIELTMSVDDAIRFVISGGILSPDKAVPISGTAVTSAQTEEKK